MFQMKNRKKAAQLVSSMFMVIGLFFIAVPAEASGYTPGDGDSYTIVSNDGADAGYGNDSKLSESAMVSSDFLRSGHSAFISSIDSDGNNAAASAGSGPDIDIQRPAGTSIANGDTDNAGNHTPGSTVTLTYIIDNSSGTDTLSLTSVGSWNFVNITTSIFNVSDWDIPAGSSGSVSLQFDIGSPGPFSFTLGIRSNDPDESYYCITIAGLSGDERNLIIQRPAGTAIADEGTDNAGDQVIGRVHLTYTVSNADGLDSVTISDVTASNFTNCDNFSLDTAMPLIVAAGGTGSIDVSFDVPVNGAFQFDMDIANDDADTSAYDIRVSGNGTGGAPDIDVQRPAGTSIANGDTDNTGNYSSGSTVNLTYIIDNSSGTDTLSLISVGSWNFVNITTSIFDVSDWNIPAGSSGSVSLQFDIGSPGPFSFTLGIRSNDPDESYIKFTVAGMSVDNRNLIIQRPADTTIADEGTDNVGDQTIGRVHLTYTVSNADGLDSVTISDVTASNFTNCDNFSLDTAMPLIVAAGGTGSIDVSFDVPVNGAFQFDMDIANNDPDTSPYDIRVSGNGTGGAPDIDVQRPTGTSIADGSVDNVGVRIPGTSLMLTYIIDNSAGTDTLNIQDIQFSNPTNVSGMTFVESPGHIISAGSFDTLGIQFNVESEGPFGLDLGVISDDSDEGSYDVHVAGTAAVLRVVPDGNTSLQDDGVLSAALHMLSVQFSLETLSGGASVPGAADNPDNYLLLQDGPLGDGFDTVSCAGGVLPDDISIPINSVSYDNTTFTATLNINNGDALSDGSYRLLVCGTTSIEDLYGNELNGGTADTAIDFRVRSISVLPETGFAPGRMTVLAAPPSALDYLDTAMVLEIPALRQNLEIMNVPQTDDGWDVSWLGRYAGFLSGTAFPTWAGNTVITGHVWDAWNQPGPFHELRSLQYGDRVYIHAFGSIHIYEVRENMVLRPAHLDEVLRHEEYDWVTLLTCEDYDSSSDSYRYRRAVRAVLIEVRESE